MDLRLTAHIKQMKEKPESCVNQLIATTQREEENSRGLNNSGTLQYERLGCYNCPGKKDNCHSYVANSDIISKLI